MKRGGPLRRSGRIRSRDGGEPARKTEFRCEPYLDHVRSLRCWYCPIGAHHVGRTQAHHVKPKGMGRANVRDDLALPVCIAHHAACHGTRAILGDLRAEPIPVERQLRSVANLLDLAAGPTGFAMPLATAAAFATARAAWEAATGATWAPPAPA